MTYPIARPTNKHDLQSSKPLPPPGRSLMSEFGFSTSTDLFRALDEPITVEAKVCSVYSYPDGPDYPGPISRDLIILGVADSSLSLVRRIVSNDGVPDCLHKCTLAVQLADAKHMPKLEPRHQKNSSAFAKFMKRLRKEEAVAIIGKDKHGRFGILAPMESDNNTSEFTAEDCALNCFIGDVKEVMDFLTGQMASAVEPSNSEPASNGMWQPPAAEEPSYDNGMWQPPGAGDEGAGSGSAFVPPWEANQTESSAPWESNQAESSAPWESNQAESSAPWETNQTESSAPWETNGGESSRQWGGENVSGNKRSFEEIEEHEEEKEGDGFHADEGAAAADAFYSGLTRSLDTRADSYLYHMRSFNGWVKATQIQELDPRIERAGRLQSKGPLRVLDLACGKGGDLTKWTLHERGMSNYVGIDVARGSLKDAAVRAREMRRRNKLSKAIFTCADLGADVPGRRKSSEYRHMQKLLTWSLEEEPQHETGDPIFKMRRGGGISETDKFDVVSIQFAIHYMMSSHQRARRFFQTVSQLLDVGGNLICTTIDARVVLDHFMNLGLDYHFAEDGTKPDFREVVVEAGAGACKIRFEPDIVRKIVTSTSDGTDADDDLFGLQYTFTLVEGSDHAAGVGDAVNLPEWLTPIPVLEALGKEAGLELEYAQNFHEFFETRKDASAYAAAHHALYNMKVLNRNGTISKDEWSVSRLYAAIKFRKVRESSIEDAETGPVQEDSDESDDEQETTDSRPVVLDPIKVKKMLPIAMMKAKKSVGEEEWKNLSSEEKKRLTQIELEKIAAA